MDTGLDDEQDMQPRDYAEPRQVIIENGRVDVLMKAVFLIGTALITTLLVWMATTLNSLDRQVATLVTWNEVRNSDHAKFDQRLTELERERRAGERYDSGAQ